MPHTLAKRTGLWLGLLLALLLGGCSPALLSPYSAPATVGEALASAIAQREAAAPRADRRLDRQAAALQADFADRLQDFVQAPYYRLHATLDETLTRLQGRLELHYTNTTGTPLTELVFRLYPNARTVYGGGGLEVNAAERDSAPLAFVLDAADPTVLRLPLQPALAAGERALVALDFTATVPTDAVMGAAGYGIFNRTAGVTVLAGWYPVLAPYDGGWQTPPVPAVGDAMVSESALFQVSFTVPAGLTVVATGTATGVVAAGDMETWELVSGPVREFALAVSDRFTHLSTAVDGVQVSFYALPSEAAPTPPEAALELAAAALRSYRARFGPYPYSEFDVVDAVVPIGGYEFSGMALVDFNLRTGAEASRYRYMLGHEVAHQWWYGLVGNRTTEEPWLDEALASWSALVFLEDTAGKAVADGLLQAWQRIYGGRDAASPAVDDPVYQFSNWQHYTTIVYYQGALFLNDARVALGDDRFFTVLQGYVADFRHRVARGDDLLVRLRAELGADFLPLYRRWFGEPEPAWDVLATPSAAGEDGRRQVID